MKTIAEFLVLLNRLSDAHIHYELAHNRDEALMVTAVVPGERWEIEVMQDGQVEVEVFRSNGEILDGAALDDLFERHSDAM